MRYTVERQWAVVDSHRGHVVETFTTEGEAYRTAYKKEAAVSKKTRLKRFQAEAAGWAIPLPEDSPDSVAIGNWPLDDKVGI